MTALYLIVALLLSILPVNNGYAQAKEGVEVYVTDNGVHTDWVLPVNTPYIDWRSKLHLQDYAGADSTFTHVAFGWGDRRFYMETPEWKDLTLTTALTALFWPTRTAMHVEYIARPLKPNKSQRPLLLTPEQYEALVAYILKTFQQQDGQFILIPNSGYYDTDNFYEANGKFYLFKTCNTWTNGGLKVIGAEAAFWAPFSFSVMRHLPEPE